MPRPVWNLQQVIITNDKCFIIASKIITYPQIIPPDER